MKKIFALTLLSLGIVAPSFAQGNVLLDLIKLPPGFRIDVYATDVPNARSMTLGRKGTVFVGNRSGDKIFALVDSDNDYEADRKYVIASELWSPNGVAFKDGDLYVAEINRVLRFKDIENHLENPPKPIIVNDSLPKDTWHGWKYIKFGPDNKLYVPVGAPCNVCERDDMRYSSIMRMDLDGKNLEIFAQGVRNTVGFDWHPATGELWFTDNGRDELGDNVPPDELNRAPQLGMHFGFPYCHGGDIPDPEFGKKYACANFNPPAQKLGPHVAALGMHFYEGAMFPEKFKNQIFIAEHGSWNRSAKIGYRIMLVALEGNKAVSYTVFAEGWKQKEKAWGRPVDILELPDGSLLVSDDHAGTIYRISYKGP